MRALQIYIHIPFCIKKCAYCDFLSFAAEDKTKQAYMDALLREIEEWEDRGDTIVSTVFFGGGTPSALPSEAIGRIMEALRGRFVFAGDAEITMECNPGTLTQEKLMDYRKMGINRLSMGLQSANDEELRTLGRIHSFGQFLENFRAAREAGFQNINVDLMSALPGQTLQSWENTLKKVIGLLPEHISAYSLIIEEHTPFYEKYAQDAARRERGDDCLYLPSEEEERCMYWRTQELLLQQGYRHYEISNYAKPGFACRHNCGYWLRKEYKGFGLGAASLLENTRFLNTDKLKEYLARRFAGGEPQKLSVSEQMEETMFLGLRMAEGVREERFEEIFGTSVRTVYREALEKLEQQGLIVCREGTVKLTRRGVDISNFVFSNFLF